MSSYRGPHKFLDCKYRNWTQDQLNILLSEYGTIPIETLASKIGKGIGSIYNILNKEDVNLKKNYWTDQEIAYLKSNYSRFSNKDLRKILQHSEDGIEFKAAQFGLKKDTWWSDSDREQLKQMKEAGFSKEEIAEELGRTKQSIHTQLVELKLTNPIRRWTPEELDIIKSMATSDYAFTYVDIALKVNAEVKQVRSTCIQKGWNINIKRPTSNGVEIILSHLRDLYGHREVITEFHIGELLRLDIYIPIKNIGIEFDGIQHFERNEHFHRTKEDFERTQQLDKRKNELCDELGINLIRFQYDDDLSKDIIKSKIESVGDGVGSDVLNTYHKNGGYISIKGLEYNENQKEKAKAYRREQYQKQKEYKKAKDGI